MRKFIVVSLILAGFMLMGGLQSPVSAQSPGIDAKPTFLNRIPGLYVHGWPSFAVSYPKDWVDQPLFPGEVFRVAALRPPVPPSPSFVVHAFPNSADISGSSELLASFLRRISQDVKVLYNKPSKLKDGTSAQEGEIEWLIPNGPKINSFLLATKKDGMWIWISLHDDKGRLGEDLMSIAYTLNVPQGKQEPAKLPSEIRELLDKSCRDIEKGDAGRMMTNFSSRFLHNGMKKAALEQWFRYAPESPIQQGFTACTYTVTYFEPQGDKAYLAGFRGGKLKSGADASPFPIGDNRLINENGQWKWYGNQK